MIKSLLIISLITLLLVAGNLKASGLGCIIEDSTLYTVTENDGSIVVARNNDSKSVELVIIRYLNDVSIIECK